MTAIRTAVFVAAAIVGVLILMGLKEPRFPVQPLAGPSVKVMTDGGHGSGVHIGSGYVLTAAHVVKAATKVKIKTDTSEVQSAEVLWSNPAYDVALLSLAKPGRVGAAALSCREPAPGEAIHADGNPQHLEFVGATGRVSGKARESGPWRSVLVTDIATIPGMSGGPVYDDRGRVVAITVGVMLVNRGLISSLVGLGFAVPGSTICRLMGRA